MSKKSQFIKQCSCCDTKFVRISIPTINLRHKADLEQHLRNGVKEIGLKGDLELVIDRGVVIGFYYEFATAKEESKAHVLCSRIYEAACDFHEALIRSESTYFYGENSLKVAY